MNVARPPDGFVVRLSTTVQQLVEATEASNPAFAAYWADILERLRFTAHREGEPDVRLGPGHRLWKAQGGDGRPRVRLVYLVLGSQLLIKVAQFG
jgi:hypothetical protein